MIRGTKNKEKGADHPAVIKKVIEEAIVEKIKIDGDHR